MLAETPFQVASTATIQPNAMSAKRGTGSILLKQNAKDAPRSLYFCLQCDPSGCKVCKDGYFLHNGECKIGCPIGTYPSLVVDKSFG